MAENYITSEKQKRIQLIASFHNFSFVTEYNY